MNRRGRADVAIVGGGVVGTCAALALARAGLDVVLVEAAAPSTWQAGQPDLRVYAIAPDNAGLLDSLGVWTAIASARAQAYRRMRVWDAAGGGELLFDADAFGRRELGWIIEHGLLVDRLWEGAIAAGVRMHCPARIAGCEQDDAGVRLQLEDGSGIDAGIAIAADGADSTLRRLAGIDVSRHDYRQRGIVAYVQTEQPHGDTAWQRFLPGGPLAFLPCPDPAGAIARPGHRSSIVWTVPDEEATRLLGLDDDAFADALTRAFDARLGRVRMQSARAAFPLRRQLAHAYVHGRILAIGDAAHVVHPLAGQGVNLGLRDVAGLRDAVIAAKSARADWSAPARLARWARARKSDNAVAAHAFDGINRVFGSDAVVPTLLRGRLLGAAGRIPPLAHLLWRRASGL
ncbi:UbiH/UbiF family hydroxylase [Cognatiluteimonas profundi]|uniref:UbiH/UbiF family hydroxylase n=1 Tax=Cognatiluteimonas profundi TaxID=2594501 RepID=UPI00131AFD44|nr:UbiH/UbiF family hydroxylase [Lysobacter profundi]